MFRQYGNFLTKISNTEFLLSCCLEFLIIHKKIVQVSFCGKEIKLKMIILRKLEIPNILRLVVTYHFAYTATARNVVVWAQDNV